jgi:hypothetical protein
MTATDPRIDAYIAKAAAFARPILAELRARVRKAWPAAEETLKWNVPFFVYEGKPLVSMAAFKKHAKFGVWSGMMPTMVDVTTVDELPPAKAFADSVKEAARQIAEGASAKVPTRPRAKTARNAPVKAKAPKKTAPKKSAPRKRVTSTR